MRAVLKFTFLPYGMWARCSLSGAKRTFSVAVNYALAPFVTLAEITRQCRAAVAWVHGHAREFGGDPSRIHVCGSSAGGHLAAMMLVPGWEADFGVPNNLVAGATLLSGLSVHPDISI